MESKIPCKIISPKTGYKITIGKGEYQNLLKEGYTEEELLQEMVQEQEIISQEVLLPEDMINTIVDHIDYKTFVDYCKTNKLIKNVCQKSYKHKLEQEIDVPLTNYSNKQINKISKMVLNGSFRQDIILNDYIFFLDEHGYLNKLVRGVPTIYKHQFVKIIKSFNNIRNKQLLLLDHQGKIWSYDFEDSWDNEDGKLTQLSKNTTVVDIDCAIRTKSIFFAALEDNGDVFVVTTDSKLDEETEYIDIDDIVGVNNGIKNGKIAVGDTHIVVLDTQGDVYFFSYLFNHQIPLNLKYRDKVPFTKIENLSHVKQILTHDDDTICLKEDGSITMFKPPSLRYDIVLNKHIVHIATNNKHFIYLLDNQGKLYQINYHNMRHFSDEINMDDYLIGENVCNFVAGTSDDVVMINNDGMYSLGNNYWNGGFTSKPYTTPMFQYNPW